MTDGKPNPNQPSRHPTTPGAAHQVPPWETGPPAAGKAPVAAAKPPAAAKKRFWSAPRLSYLCFALPALGFVFVLGGRMPYITAAVAVAILPFCIIYAFILSKFTRVGHILRQTTCRRGGEVQYRLAVQNLSLLANPGLQITLGCSRPVKGFAARHNHGLLPFGTLSRELVLRPIHRGEYHITVDSVAVSDPFCLVRFPCRRPPVHTLLSLPILRDPPEQIRSRLNEITLGQYSTLNSDDISVDARTYRPGDPVRRVHWNLTARSRELMVRRFETQARQRVVCILDLRPGDGDLHKEDALIEYALSVLRHTLRQSAPTVLLFFQEDQMRRFEGDSINAFQPMYDALTRVPLTAALPPSSLLAGCGEYACIMLFTIGEADETFLRDLPAGCRGDILEIGNENNENPRADSGQLRFFNLPIKQPDDN